MPESKVQPAVCPAPQAPSATSASPLPISEFPQNVTPSALLAGLRHFRRGRTHRSLAGHLALADSPADLDRYLSECQLRADQWEQQKAADIAAMDSDPAWLQAQGVE